MAEPVGVDYAIWVGDAPEEQEPGGQQPEMMLREVLHDEPLGKVFETGMRYMRDEGWDHVDIFRHRIVEPS